MKTGIAVLFLLASTGLAAQDPALRWKFENPHVINQSGQYVLQFDIMARATEAGTYHQNLQIFFRYDTLAFGPEVCINGNISIEKGELIKDPPGFTEWYTVSGPDCANPGIVAISIDCIITSGYGYDMPWNEFGQVLRVEMKIQNTSQMAGIEFIGEMGGVGLMNGSQYYIDPTHPTATKYGIPPDYACIYDNDLLGLILQTGFLWGTVVDLMSGPLVGAVITAGPYVTYSTYGGHYELSLSPYTYDVVFEENCSCPVTIEGVEIVKGDTTLLDVQLPPAVGIISGAVYDAITMQGIQGATVECGQGSTSTVGGGLFSLEVYCSGTYELVASFPGYYSESAIVQIECNQSIPPISIYLQPINNPTLYWRFANYSVQNDTLYFDVQVKSSQQGTFHQEVHLVFDFNPGVFGHPVINNNRFYHERLELLYGEIAGTPLYNVYSSGNQPAATINMMSVSTFTYGNPIYMNEVDTIWKGYASLKAKILDPSNPNWGIFFNEGEMNGVQTYVDVNQYNGVYGYPPGFECIYINNLGGFIPCSELKGQVHDAVSGAPVQNAHIFTGDFECYSDLNGDYSFRLPCGNIDVTADGFCHFPETVSLTISNIPVTVQDFSLPPDPNGTGIVYGLVRNINQQPIENALVQVGDSTCLTDSTGYYFLELVSGNYNLTVTAINFNPYYGTVDPDCAEFLNVPVTLDSVSTTGTLSGVISDCLTGNGIGGINVVLSPYSTVTSATGTYTIDSILPGQYQLILANPIYLNTPVVIDIWIVAGQTAIADTCLLPLYSVDLYYNINCDTVLLYWHDPAGSLTTGYRVEDNMLPVCTITDTFCLLTGQQGQHFYCVMALFQGKESFPACIQTLMEPCYPPSNLVNYHTGFSLEVPLQWNAPLYRPNAEAVIKSAMTLQEYYIYRNMWDGNGYEFLDDTPPGITHYTDYLPWYPDSASYYVTAMYSSGESLPSNETWVSFSLGTNEQGNCGLKVYPNPVKNILVIESTVNITSWVMVDLMGMVRLKSGNIQTDNLSIPVATLPEGVYYLEITTLQGNVNRKVVVTKN
ncbi:MAG: T9SS type A sorting domain-containing protein [Bacteroidales bacterium]|nr:T9SS type A sorting domain-containing protein [Bacteroidales bacterium]